MREFQYIVTVHLDDEHLEELVKEDPEILEEFDTSQENFVSFFAEKTMVEGIKETLLEGLGDAGESKVEVVFAGEQK